MVAYYRVIASLSPWGHVSGLGVERAGQTDWQPGTASAGSGQKTTSTAMITENELRASLTVSLTLLPRRFSFLSYISAE